MKLLIFTRVQFFQPSAYEPVRTVAAVQSPISVNVILVSMVIPANIELVS